jgi:CO dehydrogenase maturation factor
MCRAHAQVRHLLGALLDSPGPLTIVDMEAGLEHLTRGTGRHVDTLVVTLEPYYKALETARRCAELGRELGVPSVVAIANKIRDREDADAVRAYATAHQLDVIGEVPFDEEVRRSDLAGRAPLDTPSSKAVAAIDAIAGRLGGVARAAGGA